MSNSEIIVIGAGPAGLMASIRASELGAKVILIEKNKHPAQKILLSGKGRCNLTNSIPMEDFIPKFFHGGDFLRDAFKKFSNQDLMQFFEKLGVKLKVERQERVFPRSNSAKSIWDTLLSQVCDRKIRFILNRTVEGIQIKDGRPELVILSGKEFLPAQKVILATGGVSYPATGSTGDGIRIAGKLAHRIEPLRPSLVPLELKKGYPVILQGLSLENIRIKFTQGAKNILSEIGDLLFTHKGISGPLVVTLSDRIVLWLEKKEPVFVHIDLKPALSYEILDKRMLRELGQNNRTSLRNIMKSLLPLRLVDVFLEMNSIDASKKASYVTQKERARIVQVLKDFSFEVSSAGTFDEAMVTRGGVSLKDINPKNMESRLIKGLYFAGEIMDVHADTGGFNLQAAFSTGYLAGESAAISCQPLAVS
ncbi:MAG: NAD(P)/FAD-dependent oxidoreductase [Candidatus Omnitrophica bacterium]|jgi:hypothetical protein|nr:NAD(P)/FAD-dependent oxidoreductase [Candidatus Omnitrophota bacterium]